MISSAAISIAMNAAGRAMRSGKLLDIEKEVRRSSSGEAQPEEYVQGLVSLATTFFMFGESVRVAVQKNNSLTGFGNHPDED